MFDRLSDELIFKGFKHHVFSNADEAVNFALLSMRKSEKVYICILKQNKKLHAILVNMLSGKNKNVLLENLQKKTSELARVDELFWYSDISGAVRPVYIVYVKK